MPPSDLYDAADTRHRAAHLAGRRRGRGAGRRRRAAGHPRARQPDRARRRWGSASRTCAPPIANANALAPLGIIDGAEQRDRHRDQRPAAHARGLQAASSSRRPTATSCGCRRRRRASSRARATRARPACSTASRPSCSSSPSSADANVIETVDRIHALLPELKRWIPAGIDISVLSDRTTTHPRQRARHAAHAGAVDRAGDAGGLRVPAAAARRPSPPASPCRCRWPAPAR